MGRKNRLAGGLVTLGLVGATACHPATSVRLHVVNPSTVPVIVDVTNTDARENPLRSESKLLPAASVQKDAEGHVLLGPDGQPLLTASSASVEWSGVSRLSTLKIEYRPETSTARFALEPALTVHDSVEPFTKEVSVGGLRAYDPAASEQTLAQLARELGGGASAELSERLVDVAPLLGSVVVASFKMNQDGAEAAQVHGSVHLLEARYTHAPALSLRGQSHTDQQVVLKVASQVPALAPLAGLMNTSDVYRLAWSVQHTQVQNAAFELASALEAATVAQLRSIHNLLVAYPESTLVVLSGLHVIDSASFGVTGGHAIQNSTSASTSAVFTGSSAYSFSLADETYAALPSLVVNVKYDKETDRNATILLLQKLIKNKGLSDVPPSAAALKSLRDAVHNGLTPVEAASATIVRDTLKQPRL